MNVLLLGHCSIDILYLQYVHTTYKHIDILTLNLLNLKKKPIVFKWITSSVFTAYISYNSLIFLKKKTFTKVIKP